MKNATEYYALLDTEELMPLGFCKDFSEADEKAPGNTHWIFSRDGLVKLQEELKRELGEPS